MQTHTIRPSHRRPRKIRIGRGGKRGSYSGRGIKGQKARAGRRIRPEMRDLIMKMPKRRGYRHTGPAKLAAVISARVIAKKFSVGEKVTPKALVAKRLVRRVRGRIPQIKILGPFDTLKNHTIKSAEFSRKKQA